MSNKKTKSIGVRIEPKTRKILEDFVRDEAKRTGYKITLSGVIQKIIDEWISEQGLDKVPLEVIKKGRGHS